MKKNASILIFLLISISLIFSACTPEGNAAEPTEEDTALIYTAAAQTVEAQLTSAAEQLPPATETPAPTQPPTAEVAQPVQPTQPVPATQGGAGQPAPTQGAAGQPVATATAFTLPTLTATNPPPSSVTYELVSQSPSDNTIVSINHQFDMIWEIKNTGTTTWTELFTIEHFMGVRIGGTRYTDNRYYFRETVAPGESTFVIVDMMAPDKHGEYYSWWKLKDDLGSNFGDVDVTIIVGDVDEDD